MSKTTKEVSAVDLVGVTLPIKTTTYTVISHGFIIDEVRTALRRAGFEIVLEQYRANNNLEVARGSYIIRRAEDPSFMMSFNWVNSYDKSTKFQCAVGGYVLENNSFVIDKEDNAFIRKHTGDADSIARETIKEKIENAEKYYLSILNAKRKMETIKLTRSQVAKSLGELYFSYDILSIEQLSGIKKEYTKPSYVYSSDADSLWTVYCHILTIIKSCHPKLWIQQQTFIHNYFKVNYLMSDVYDVAVPLAPTEAVEVTEIMPTPVTVEVEAETEIEIHVESDQEYLERVAEIEGEPEILYDNEEEVLFSAPEIDVVEVEPSTNDSINAVIDDVIINALQKEINNIFGEELSIKVYQEDNNYNVVTSDGQEVTVPIDYVKTLI